MVRDLINDKLERLIRQHAELKTEFEKIGREITDCYEIREMSLNGNLTEFIITEDSISEKTQDLMEEAFRHAIHDYDSE